MRENPDYAFDDVAGIKEFIRQNPWCTFTTYVPGAGLVASHYPVMLEEDIFGDRAGAAEDGVEKIVLVSHVGRPDEEKHQLGQHEMLAIIQGPHGYISPGWYGYRPNVPTWNFAVAHLTGTPEILSDQENLTVLDALVEHFEKVLPDPHLLHATAENSEYAHRIVRGTVGFRLEVTRFEAKEKMSQDKPASSVRTIIDTLRAPGPYTNPALAERMEHVNAVKLSAESSAGEKEA
ncbi:FMN-binding negative transcriptional regulator [Nesterenkonia flava]|uniref:FMN-binding negative transcriptional regulator n=1 Tax=Nesterenkonia flava TaxID=469799 RepID=A0ABU1FTD6_9MICC|nr:FMN-binding negative transcriptional regulator [Nesterenkonia flava]MDR5711920.1 FMN-binding negative transcriptional regulator [Nesterenkonia flava]